MKLLAYVGAREQNAFFYPQEGSLNLAVPVEEAPEWRDLVMVHEMTHAVNHALAGFPEGWERTIARTLFAEGLAARVTEGAASRPGRRSISGAQAGLARRGAGESAERSSQASARICAPRTLRP